MYFYSLFTHFITFLTYSWVQLINSAFLFPCSTVQKCSYNLKNRGALHLLLCTNNTILVNVKPPGLTIVTNQWLKPTSHSGEGLRVQPTVVTSEHESWRVESQTHNVWLLCCRTRQDCSLTVISAMLWTASPHSLRNFILEVSKKKKNGSSECRSY